MDSPTDPQAADTSPVSSGGGRRGVVVILLVGIFGLLLIIAGLLWTSHRSNHANTAASSGAAKGSSSGTTGSSGGVGASSASGSAGSGSGSGSNGSGSNGTGSPTTGSSTTGSSTASTGSTTTGTGRLGVNLPVNANEAFVFVSDSVTPDPVACPTNANSQPVTVRWGVSGASYVKLDIEHTDGSSYLHQEPAVGSFLFGYVCGPPTTVVLTAYDPYGHTMTRTLTITTKA